MSFITDVIIPSIGVIGGAGTLVAGLAGYLKAKDLARQQAVLTAQLEGLKGELQARLELLKLDNERLAFAHTKQFEKEFSLYEKLWQNLWTLHAAARYVTDDQGRKLRGLHTGEDEFTKSRKDVLDELKKVSEITEYNAPFFHLEVYTALKELQQICLRAWLKDQSREPGKLNPSDEREIELQLIRVCEKIRWRIGLTSIRAESEFLTNSNAVNQP